MLKSFFCTLILISLGLQSHGQDYGSEVDYFYKNFSLESGFPSSQVYQIFEDGKGFKWFITDRGVVQYDGHNVKVFSTKDGLADLVNFTIIAEDQNKFWLQGSKGRMSYWDGNQFKAFKFNNTITEYFHNSAVYLNLINIEKKHLIIGYSKKAYKIDRTSGELTKIKYSITKSSLKNNLRPQWIKLWGDQSLKSIFENLNFNHKKKYSTTSISQFNSDPNWFGVATTKGAHLFNTKTKEHLVFFPQLQVNTVYQDKNGGIWITTHNKGVYYIPSMLIKRLHLPKEVLNDSYKKFLILNESLIIKPNEKDIYRITVDKKELLQYAKTIIYSPSVLTNSFNTHNYQISEKDGKLEKMRRPNAHKTYYLLNGDTLINNNFKLLIRNKKVLFESNVMFKNYYLKEESESSFWIGDKFGLSHITKTKGIYKRTKQKLSLKNKFVRINDIELDKYGNLWLATLENGVILLKNGKVTHLKHPKLLSTVIHNLYLQNDHILWIATNSGLNKLVYKTEDKNLVSKVETYTVHDGLLSNFINDIIFWNDKLYLATDRGVCFFDPKKVVEFKTQPRILINGLYINSLSSNFLDVKQVFKSNENDVRFVYNGITTNIPLDKNKFYRYRLQNSKDDKWKLTNSPNITFHNLPFGKYTFELQCQTINQVWSESALSSFEIKPHIVETWWFKVPMIIALILIISFIIYFRSESQHKKTKQLLTTKKSELAVLTNQMNPHFIFNTMNAIESFVLSQEPLMACEYIGKFSALMRKSIAYSSMEFISIENEITFMEKYLELEKLRFGDHFKYKIDNQIDTNVQIPPLLAQPLVENAIKHAFKGMTGNGKIELSYTINPQNAVTICIKDNGVGFDESKNQKMDSYGLNIIKERLRIYNNEAKNNRYSLEINSSMNKGEGTIVSLHIPFKNG